MDATVAGIRAQPRARRLAWCWTTLREHWLMWQRQIIRARHLRHGRWGWPVAIPHLQDLW